MAKRLKGKIKTVNMLRGRIKCITRTKGKVQQK